LRLDLDEIVQDTFVRAYESLRSFRGDDIPSFARWLMGIARIAVIRAASPPGAGQLALGDGIAAEAGASPSAALRREERFERLQVSLDTLTGDYREVLYLARIEGLSMKEIADRMGRSPEAVKKLFGRALAKLRERFGDTESFHLPDRQLHLEGGGHED
ncbi:MAG: sigma-70 family RNA polymerase sigma factor, partial [Planctomycetes bacterium]|nr:sigma-70 family RNA polymerase sigma factor [Planctomycetota bacterium]